MNNFREISEYAVISGQISAILFAFTLIPGSMQRFGLLKSVYAVGVYYRRPMGKFMYLFALFHLIARMNTIPLFNPTIKTFSEVVVLGLISFVMLLPVYLTGTNWGIKTLKRNWKLVQRICYIVFFILLVHLYLAASMELFYFFIIVGVFVILSWIYKYSKK